MSSSRTIASAPRRGRRIGRVAALALVGLACVTGASAAGAEAKWPGTVTAVYKITFNGFDIGHFRFRAQVDAAGYSLDGKAEITALLGAFRWQGVTRTVGTVGGDQPHPAGYSFDYESSLKSGNIRMGFRDDNVTSLTADPPGEDQDVVPLRAQHVQGVLDPLSAVMALTRADGRAPCGKRLAIFDGKQRFDLQLSYRGLQRISETQPSGLPSDAVVCAVRYQPIAGHKRADAPKATPEHSGIEVTLRPVPSANLLIPTRIVVPTGAGSAVLTSERVDIETSGAGRIALVY